MITLIGTGHVFDLSQALLEILDERQPQVIGVELDRQRYQGLMSKASRPSETQKKKKVVASDKDTSIDDPIRLYLKEIGKENLLTIPWL